MCTWRFFSGMPGHIHRGHASHHCLMKTLAAIPSLINSFHCCLQSFRVWTNDHVDDCIQTVQSPFWSLLPTKTSNVVRKFCHMTVTWQSHCWQSFKEVHQLWNMDRLLEQSYNKKLRTTFELIHNDLCERLHVTAPSIYILVSRLREQCVPTTTCQKQHFTGLVRVALCRSSTTTFPYASPSCTGRGKCCLKLIPLATI